MKFFGKKIASYSALIAVFAAISIKAIAMDPEEMQSYSNFIVNVVYDIELERKGQFCIFGNDEIAKDLITKFPEALKISEESLEANYKFCNLIYVSQGNERGLRIHLERIGKNKIVTIGTFEGFVNMGGAIQIQLGRRSFEITTNPKLLKISGAKLGIFATNLIIN
jgi:hypothetical protein